MNHKYELGTCRSQVDFLSDNEITDKIKSFKIAKAVAWYYDEIVFYKIENGNFNITKRLDELVRLRLFDENKELHVWRTNGTLKGRLRSDSIEGDGDETEFVEAKPLLNGTSFSPSRSGIGITAIEEKGIKYDLPFTELETMVGTKNRIILLTRNYIGYSDIGQAGYIDCRFIKFDIKKTPKHK